MLTLLVALTLSASERPRLVVQDFVAKDAADAAVVQAITSRVARELVRRGVHDVVTSEDVRTILGLERQRQLLGCSEESSSCVLELAGALGAAFLTTGTLTHVGSALQLSLQTVDGASGRAVGRAVRVGRTVDELLQGFDAVVAEAAGLPPPVAPSRVAPAVLLGVGAAAAVTGAVFLVQSGFLERELVTELSLAEKNPAVLRPVGAYDAAQANVVTQRALGLSLGISGLLAAAAGALWLGLSGGGGGVAGWLTSSSAGVVFTGGLP